MNEDLKNHRAWEMLDEALFVSSHVKDEDRNRGETDWENVYPISLEETNRIEELVKKAVEAADDPREENFTNRVEELRDIVEYSRKRHRTWKWAIIGGAVLAAAFFWWCTSDNEEDVNNAKQLVAQVEAWTERDTTVAYENVQSNYAYDYSGRYNSAVAYKMYNLIRYKSLAEERTAAAKAHTLSADTAKTKEAKKKYLKYADQETQDAADARKDFDKMQKTGFKQLKKEALKETKETLSYKNSARNSTMRWTIFLCILIPLYIISGYAYGYVITAHRRRQNILDKIQTWGFAIGGFFFGTGFAMSLLPDYKVITTYSSGRKESHTESDPANILIIGLKVALMVIGAFIFSFICVLIMTVQTISGLKNNFNWQPLIAKVKEQTQKAGKKEK